MADNTRIGRNLVASGCNSRKQKSTKAPNAHALRQTKIQLDTKGNARRKRQQRAFGAKAAIFITTHYYTVKIIRLADPYP